MTNQIMVVDDDADFRRTLEVILMDEGWDVISAGDGFQAVQMAGKSDISLIFMDIRMPDMDGVETLSKIKEILPDCIVVMMTGHALEFLIEKALSEGAMTCLNKPILIEQLLKIVDEVMPQSITS